MTTTAVIQKKSPLVKIKPVTVIGKSIPSVGISKFVFELAKAHRIRFSKASASNKQLASMITRLSDDVVVTDKTEEMLIELRRAHVIDNKTMVVILGKYLAERNNV